MSHVASPHWIDLLGLLAGSLGVCIAVWLQLVTPRCVRPRYVVGFLALGCSLMLINLGPLVPDTDVALAARLLAYLGLVAAQSYLAYRVWAESELHPVEETREWYEEVVE